VLTPPPSSDGAQTQFVDPRASTARGDQRVPPAVLTPPDDAQTRFGDPIAPTEVVRPHQHEHDPDHQRARAAHASGRRQIAFKDDVGASPRLGKFRERRLRTVCG
jgi:hypothetical protein